MPMVGLILPTHQERKTDAPGRYPKWDSVQNILANAEVASPKWSPWNYELIKALMNEHQERGARLSVTTLTGGCMRGNIIERKEDYIGSLDSSYAALKGTLIHRTLEASQRPGSIAEWRFYVDVDGQEISGSPDLITYDTIWDWKTTENPPVYSYMYEGHKLQLNFNRFIFNQAKKWDAAPGDDPLRPPLDPHNTKIQHLAIVYLGPKGPKVLETSKKDPRGGRYNVPDVMTDAEVLAELRPRMKAWKMAWDAYPKWPTDLETMPGWAGPKDWTCPGAPLCYLPGCMAKRYKSQKDKTGLVWPSP